MLKRSLTALFADENDDSVDMARLWRLAYWGGAAALTLIVVVLAGRSETGVQRIRMAVGSTAVQQAFDAQAETRRLSERVRQLAADRARLQTRLASLERNLDDVTGSVVRELRAVRAAAAAKPAPPAPPKIASVASAPPKDAAEKAQNDAAAPPAATPTASATPKPMADAPAAAAPKSKAEAPADVPLPRPGPVISARSTGGPLITVPLMPLAAAPKKPLTSLQAAPKEPATTGSTTIRTEFGIDLGTARTMVILRDQWKKIRHAHPKLLEGMRPIVFIRDVAKRRTVELHLVIGPIADKKTAAQRCAALVTAGLNSCKTTKYEGQRLATR